MTPAGTSTSQLPTAVSQGIAALRARPITPADKAWGPVAAGRTLSAASLRAAPVPLTELSLPVMTLSESALDHNITGMAAYCATAGVALAPHGKTMMAPQLAARQLAAGAWGITVASVEQLQAYRAYGFARFLIANQVVDPAGLAWLATELTASPDLEVYCYVDSQQGVGILDQALSAANAERRLPVLIEMGFPGGRTGVRNAETAGAVAQAVTATATLRVAGVAGYEGVLAHDAGPQALERVAGYCRSLRLLLQDLEDRGLATGAQLLSGGGSAYFDAVVQALGAGWEGRARPTVVIRSGAYITHDHGFYARVSPADRHAAGPLTLIPAITVWATVLSRPEPTLALLGAGRRDLPFDYDLPVVLQSRHRQEQSPVDTGDSPSPADRPTAMTVTELNDQHAYLKVPETARLEPGDLVALGISHPCTAFDKWRVIPVVDERGMVIDAVHTLF